MTTLQTPEERLCSRSWRLRNSSWLLWSILSIGILTGIGFLLHAIASKRKSLFIMAGVWLAVAAAYIALSSNIDTGTKENPVESTEASFVSGFLFFTWVGGVTNSIVMNRSWLRWKAHKPNGQPWYSNSEASTSNNLKRGATEQSKVVDAFALAGVTSGNDRTESALNINSADLESLTALGLDSASASKLLDARDASGPFSDTDDLLKRSGVSPHFLLGLGDQIIFNETGDDSSDADSPNVPPANTRRKLDF